MSTDAVPSRPVPSHLTDDQLTAAVQRFARDARASTAELVAHLAEFDTRRLYLAAGCSSLFSYCFEVLRLSEHAAYDRIEAARAARLFPTIVERLAEGTLNLTTVRLLAPHLTREFVDTDRDARRNQQAATRRRPGAGSLRDPFHRERRHARKAEGGAGAPQARATRRRHR